WVSPAALRHGDAVAALTGRLVAAQAAPALRAARRFVRPGAAQLRAEAAISLRDEVLAGVSPDLAGPLARIRLYAELINSESAAILAGESALQLAMWSERIVAATTSMKATS